MYINVIYDTNWQVYTLFDYRGLRSLLLLTTLLFWKFRNFMIFIIHMPLVYVIDFWLFLLPNLNWKRQTESIAIKALKLNNWRQNKREKGKILTQTFMEKRWHLLTYMEDHEWIFFSLGIGNSVIELGHCSCYWFALHIC